MLTSALLRQILRFSKLSIKFLEYETWPPQDIYFKSPSKEDFNTVPYVFHFLLDSSCLPSIMKPKVMADVTHIVFVFIFHTLKTFKTFEKTPCFLKEEEKKYGSLGRV